MAIIYLHVDGRQAGPFGEEELRAMVIRGQATRRQLAWQEGAAEWLPLEEVVDLPRATPPPVPGTLLPVFPQGLPPLPTRMGSRSTAPLTTAPANSALRAIRTVSAVVALLLGLLTIVNVGGCMNARDKLATFQNGDDALATANLLLDTARGMHNGDPLSGVSGMLDKAGALDDDYRSSRSAAWVCLVGTLLTGAVCGGCVLSDRTRPS